ncbi:MAG: protein translocase subunit SecF [Desertimonas sp.]
MSTETTTPVETSGTAVPIAKSSLRRLLLGQTAIDFWGRRKIWFALSALFIVITIVSLLVRGLSLGIDFEGGVAWDVPADEFSIDEARGVLEANGVEADNAKIQERQSDSGSIIKVQVEDQPEEMRVAIQEALAEAAGVEVPDVSVASVSSTWGWEITKQAIIALVVFLALIAVYISFRFEWEMALAALAAMVHDVVISVGIYSVFGFEVTPATVIAFLTILGYSLYDSIVVFDKVKENERRIAAAGLSAADLVNVSTNQVLLRSLTTTMSSALPVLALLLIGAGLLGQVTLREFAIALLVGMLTGAYSSLFVATPLLGWLKSRSPELRRRRGQGHLVDDELRQVVVSGLAGVRSSGRRRGVRRAERSASADAEHDGEGAETDAAATGGVEPTADVLLSHAPRPRKKKRR